MTHHNFCFFCWPKQTTWLSSESSGGEIHTLSLDRRNRKAMWREGVDIERCIEFGSLMQFATCSQADPSAFVQCPALCCIQMCLLPIALQETPAKLSGLKHQPLFLLMIPGVSQVGSTGMTHLCSNVMSPGLLTWLQFKLKALGVT